jgi:hypothetical protein
MVGEAIAKGIEALVGILIVAVIVSIFGIGYFIYNFFFADHKTVKTTEKPAITWELKANKQTIDTVWVYKFK